MNGSSGRRDAQNPIRPRRAGGAPSRQAGNGNDRPLCCPLPMVDADAPPSCARPAVCEATRRAGDLAYGCFATTLACIPHPWKAPPAFAGVLSQAAHVARNSSVPTDVRDRSIARCHTRFSRPSSQIIRSFACPGAPSDCYFLASKARRTSERRRTYSLGCPGRGFRCGGAGRREDGFEPRHWPPPLPFRTDGASR